MIYRGNKPYKCENCSKTFVEKQHLTCHVRIHTGEKLYSWRTCGKTFIQYGTLYKYLRTHNKNKPHKCQFCDKSGIWTETVDESFTCIDAFWKQREVIHVKDFVFHVKTSLKHLRYLLVLQLLIFFSYFDFKFFFLFHKKFNFGTRINWNFSLFFKKCNSCSVFPHEIFLAEIK